MLLFILFIQLYIKIQGENNFHTTKNSGNYDGISKCHLRPDQLFLWLKKLEVVKVKIDHNVTIQYSISSGSLYIIDH